MKAFKRGAALLLALTLLTSAAACGNRNNPTETPAPEFVYEASYAPMPAGVQNIGQAYWHDGRVYFMASMVDGKDSYTDPETGVVNEYDRYVEKLYSMKDDGTGASALSAYEALPIPAGMEGNSYVQRLSVDADGNLWTCEQLYASVPMDPGENGGSIPYAGDTFVTESGVAVRALSVAVAMPAPTSGSDIYGGEITSIEKNYLRKLDSTGAELLRIDLSEIAAGADDENQYFYVSGLQMDADGNIFLCMGENSIFVLNGEGKLQFTIKINSDNSWINGLVRLRDGRVAAMGNDYSQTADRSQFLRVVDLATKDWGEDFSAPMDVWNPYPGGGDYDFYYNTSTSLFGAKLEAGESETEKLLSWLSCDIDGDSLNAVLPLPDGRILCVTSSWDRYTGEEGQSELITLSKVPYVAENQKTVLTYACMYLDYNLRREILNFNKTNPNYRIEVQDYSEYNTEDDYTAGLTKLSTEIIAGRVPDILQADAQMPIRQYAAKGLLEDLWPYIDADPELGREQLMEPVLKAMEQDGKLYQVTGSFMLYSAVALRSIAGDAKGWTVDEMYEALAKLPPGADILGYSYTRDDVLRMTCAFSLDELVDWETGACRFDGPEFIKILEFVSSFKSSFDWEDYWSNHEWTAEDDDDVTRMRAGKQLMMPAYLYDFTSYQMQMAQLEGDVNFIGFPTEDRNGTAFELSMALSMSAKSAHKDGVWEFLRTVLLPAYQNTIRWNGFATNKEAFQAQIDEAMKEETYEDPATGETVIQPKMTWGTMTGEIEIFAMTQEEVDQVVVFINATNRVFSYDEKLFEIISEECQPYFADQKSVEETAKLVQNRVSLYVNEQR